MFTDLLQWESDDWERTCDGCGRGIPGGESHLTNIESCCGGGCYRVLCKQCVLKAAEMAKNEE